jgi:hypothetical protein
VNSIKHPMKLKATILTLAMMGLSAAALAAPSLQTCNPMEVLHNGVSGLSYNLSCEAGSWKLAYTGSVPAGTKEVQAKYRLTVTGPRGEAFTHSRQVRLPEPAMLGQVLLREAVLLDNGDLALRACEPIGCTQYRPLGSPKAGLTEATITGSQEILRLKKEVLRLDELSTTRGAELTSAREALAARQATLLELKNEVGRLTDELGTVRSQADADRGSLMAQLRTAQAHRDDAQKALAVSQAATLTAQSAASAAQAAVATAAVAVAAPMAVPMPTIAAPIFAAPIPAIVASPEPANQGSAQMDRQLAAILGLDDELAGKYERLKLEHAETLEKLDRAQNQAALAAAKLETVLLTQSLTAQNLTIAHAELDSARHELAQLKRERVRDAAAPAAPEKACPTPIQAPTMIAKVPGEDSTELQVKDGVIGRVTSALVSANTQILALKAELDAARKSQAQPATRR